ncbi:hypothetical protein HDZ31DRAFT_45059 [Schizophyllum fasciatum]
MSTEPAWIASVPATCPCCNYPVGAPAKDVRSWQIPRGLCGHHVLGWLATKELCESLCRRKCPVQSHKENGDPPDNFDFHIRMVQQRIGTRVHHKFKLDCRGSCPVFIDDTQTKFKWAIVVSDNMGETMEQRRLPSPEVVDRIKEFLGIEEEPRWWQCFDSKR